MKSERGDHTLQPTAIVHEAFVRLVEANHIDWNGKTHFFCIAAREMRHVLVEHGRARHRRKRGGGAMQVTLSEAIGATRDAPVDLLALDEALRHLEQVSERQCRVAELRLFSGMTHPEIAQALEISERTVKQDWQLARVWLTRELSATSAR